MVGNGSLFGEDYHRKLMEFGKYYYIVCTFVFGPLILSGLVGNIISFFTWGKVEPQNAITFLLRTLAVFDCFLLLVMILPVYMVVIQLENNVDGWVYTSAEMLWPYTRVYIYPFINMCVFANTWTTALIGMNRYIAVCRGLHAVRLCTVSQARKHIICIIIVSILFNLPRFFECRLRDEPDGSAYLACPLVYNVWYLYIYSLGCQIIGIFLIPFGMLLFFCVRISLALRSARRQQINRHGERLDTRITSMLIILLGIFLVCQAYWGIHMIVVVLAPYTQYFLLFQHYSLSCSDSLILINSSVNFLIYMLYMKEYRKLLCKKCGHRSESSRVYELTWREINVIHANIYCKRYL